MIWWSPSNQKNWYWFSSNIHSLFSGLKSGKFCALFHILAIKFARGNCWSRYLWQGGKSYKSFTSTILGTLYTSRIYCYIMWYWIIWWNVKYQQAFFQLGKEQFTDNDPKSKYSRYLSAMYSMFLEQSK